jgi:site-specific recombinase XerD
MSTFDPQTIIASDTRYWSPERQVILMLIGLSLNDRLVLDQAGIDQLLRKYVAMEGLLTREKLKTLRETLTWLEANGQVKSAAKIPQVLRPLRPSMLARRNAVHRAVPVVTQIYHYMWDFWLTHSFDRDQLFPPFIISLMADGGFGAPYAPYAFFNLRKADIRPDKRLILPLHLKDSSEHRAVVAIPPSSQLLLAASARARHDDPDNDYIYMRNITDPVDRTRSLTQELRNEYGRLAHAFTVDSGIQAPSWHVFQTAASQRALHAGVSPALLYLQSRAPWPVSVRTHRIQVTAPTPDRVRSGFHVDRQNSSVRIMESFSSPGPTPSNWSERSCACLHNLASRLGKLTSRNLQEPAYINRALEVVNDFRKTADLLSPHPKSALHLALDWTIHQIHNARSQKASTLTTYFERVFTTGLLLSSDSAYFDMLSPTRHLDILETTLNRSEIDASRQSDIFRTWKSVYRFAVAAGYCSHDLTAELDITYYASRRPFLLTPQDFDTIFKEIWDKGFWEYRSLAVLYALCFYGGIRTDEVIELTTRDMIDGVGLLDIYVPGYKSVSARRMVPFGHLAPRFIVECVTEYWRTRKALTTNATGYLYLFGPADNIGRYNPPDLEDYGRRYLRFCTGGHPALNSLRHGFGSWLVVRFHALRHPEFLKTLPERDHVIFSPDGLSRLRFLLMGSYDKPLPDDYALGLEELSRLMGHADPSTLFQNYAHTFDRIQADLQNTLAVNLGSEIHLNREVVAQLIPNMKSSRSRAKLDKPLTASALLDHAWSNV